jgi:hypothetical protein
MCRRLKFSYEMPNLDGVKLDHSETDHAEAHQGLYHQKIMCKQKTEQSI